jgi:hypothetical protein
LHRGGDDAVCRVTAPGQQINQFSTYENLLILEFLQLGSFLFFKVAMQANVPQPAADEDDGDDVDEGRRRHDSSSALSATL